MGNLTQLKRNDHPITQLIKESQKEFDKYQYKQKNCFSFTEIVADYRRKYKVGVSIDLDNDLLILVASPSTQL